VIFGGLPLFHAFRADVHAQRRRRSGASLSCCRGSTRTLPCGCWLTTRDGVRRRPDECTARCCTCLSQAPSRLASSAGEDERRPHVGCDSTCSSALYIVGDARNEHRRVVVSQQPQACNRVEPRQQRQGRAHCDGDVERARLPNAWRAAGRPRRFHVTRGELQEIGLVTSTLLIRLACVSSAPLGRPVVPEVYSRTAVSSAARFEQLRLRVNRCEQIAERGRVDQDRLGVEPPLATHLDSPAVGVPGERSAGRRSRRGSRQPRAP